MTHQTYFHTDSPEEGGRTWIAHDRIEADGKRFGGLQKHPMDAEWVWTRCCGFVAKNGQILPTPIPSPQPLLSPAAQKRLSTSPIVRLVGRVQEVLGG